jgi:hypothetical protein
MASPTKIRTVELDGGDKAVMNTLWKLLWDFLRDYADFWGRVNPSSVTVDGKCIVTLKSDFCEYEWNIVRNWLECQGYSIKEDRGSHIIMGK